jgi:hypothetical protein
MELNDVCTVEDIAAWFKAAEELKHARAKEILLRNRIARHFFPEAKEGTNTHVLPDGYQLKWVHKIDRNIDVGPYTVLRDQMLAAKIALDSVVLWKPDLAIKEYRELTEEQMKLFDQCLVIKPSQGALSIAAPPKGKT